MKKKSRTQENKKRNMLGLFVFAFLAISISAILIANPVNEGSLNLSKTAYMANDNNVVCTLAEPKLKCENLQNNEVKEFTIPKAYQSQDITPSPDGSKLLIRTVDGAVVVTDTNFIELRKVFKTGELTDRYPAFAWADGSKQLLISEVRREQNDLASLEAPIVVKMLNIETGQSDRVYKTGETVDPERVRVLGGNSEYIFVAYDTPKNWVADSTNAPPQTLNAVSLVDGSVQPINSHQISANEIYYDSNKDTFTSVSQNGDDPSKNHIEVAKLESGDFGLQLRKDFETDTTGYIGLVAPTFTSKGMVFTNIEFPKPFDLIQDNGTVTKTQLTQDNIYSDLKSLYSMPNL